jgi:chloramphenicol O-acetyltransferase type A
MREIDLAAWPRRRHFETFRAFYDPLFSMCADVDVAVLRSEVDARHLPFTAAVVFVIAQAANDIPQFRQRIRHDTVVEHDVVHPSTTILVDDDLFSFCTLDHLPEFSAFAAHYADRVAEVRDRPTVDTSSDRDDVLFMSAIPWVSFTSFQHPVLSNPADSIPRFAWGRVHPDGDRVMMPLSVQAHHALVDGLHVGRFYQAVEGYLRNPEVLLDT